MPEFIAFKTAVAQQFEMMKGHKLFRTGTSKDVMWETYLSSFPPGTDNLYKERTEHDCQTCKSFIRAVGNVVAVINNKVVSIWDVDTNEIYQPVADALSEVVKCSDIKTIFLTTERNAGVDVTRQLLESGDVKKWNHFFVQIPSQCICSSDEIGTKLGTTESMRSVFKRSLDKITTESIEIVLDLIDQNSLYRGTEHKATVTKFAKAKKAYDKLTDRTKKDNFTWVQQPIPIRNTVIGTLLSDISEGKELDRAVKSFEEKVAPANYKRTTALITKGMIKKAQEKVEQLGFLSALERRYAIADDITINNVLFADRDAKKVMGVFEELASTVPANTKKMDKVEEVSIDKFVKSILPKADSIELMVENKHTSNMVSLIAPTDPDSKCMLKWPNNFSWAYNGDVTDSMKDRVKRAGGNVTGVLRFSIQWNDDGKNNIDFDAHCIEPNGNLISYPKKGRKQPSSGMLDVDIMNPGTKVAVENITWDSKSKMQEGEYTIIVHNYSNRQSNGGFSAELEYGGEIHSYSYDQNLRGRQKIEVAKFKFTHANGIEFIRSLPSSMSSQEVWGINTQQFHKVKMIMNSPNHWDENEVGNKHYFFIIDGCKQDGPARGFFNEFLVDSLTEHRKVFEVLGSKIKTEESDEQLSGVGFSSTQRNSILCKVSGSFSRTIKIIF